jgi:hypothetical protein
MASYVDDDNATFLSRGCYGKRRSLIHCDIIRGYTLDVQASSYLHVPLRYRDTRKPRQPGPWDVWELLWICWIFPPTILNRGVAWSLIARVHSAVVVGVIKRKCGSEV